MLNGGIERMELKKLENQERHNSIHGNWDHACPPYELGMEFTVVVEGNGGKNDKSIWEGPG